MEAWRLILDPPMSGAENMATDEAILRGIEEGVSYGQEVLPTLRIYGWETPTVSIGYRQQAGPFSSLNYNGRPLQVVRRITGGGAVLHASEITYSIVSPLANPLFSSEVVGAYKVISRAISAALNEFGVDAAFFFKTDKPPVRKGGKAKGGQREPCFLTTSRYEVVVGGKKIAGSAQRRFKDVFLLHGSILLDLDRDLTERVFGPEAARKTASVSDFAEVDPDEFKGVLIEKIEESLNAYFTLGRLGPDETYHMGILKDEKYSKLDWNEAGGANS